MRARESLSPAMLYAQETQSNWQDGVTKALTLLGAIFVAAASFVEIAMLAAIGVVVLAAAALWDFDVWVNTYLAGAGGGTSPCNDYEELVVEDLMTYYDPEMEYYCR